MDLTSYNDNLNNAIKAYQGYNNSAYAPNVQKTDKQNLDIAALGENPQQYGGTFKQAYQGLSQPQEGHEGVIMSGTQELADAYIDRVLEKTGKLPDAAQVKDFVSSNLDDSFAKNYIRGSINRDQIKTQLVDPYLQGHPGGDSTGVEGRMDSLNSKLEQYYKGAGDYANDNINRAFNANKVNVANDLAGAGLLSSPTSRYSLNDLEGQRGLAIGNAQATLAGQKAAGQTDLSKTIESILAGQRGLDQNASQFGQTLRFSKDQASYQQDLNRQQMDLAKVLGRMQADASKPGWDDKVLAGLSGARSAAGTYNSYKQSQSY